MPIVTGFRRGTSAMVDIHLFGAKGDGVTNDTPALLRAAATGLPVLLGEKTYLLYAGAAIDFDFAVIGSHRQRSILRWGDTTGDDSLLLFGGALNARFSNLTMDGNRQVHTDNTSYFSMIDFRCDDGSRLAIDRVDFINGRIVDIFVIGPTADGEMIDFDIQNCRFSDGLVGTSTARGAQCVHMSDNVDAKIMNNRASLPTMPTTYGRAGFVMQRDGVSPVITSYGRFTAVGNRFKNIGFGTSNTLGCLDCYSGAQITVMTGNAGENVPGRFICVKGDQDTISITGNVVKNAYSSLDTVCTPFVMFGDLFDAEKDRDVIFANNIVRGSSGYGFWFDGRNAADAIDFRNVLISANIADDCAIAGFHFRNLENVLLSAPMADACLSGVSVTGCGGVFKVDGGLITNSTQHGISLFEAAGAMTDMDIVLKGTTIQNTTSNAINLTEVKSYDLDVDIDTAAIGLVTVGSTGLSRIRARMRGATEPWSKTGTDAKLRPPEIESDIDLNYSNLRLRTIASGVISVLLKYHWVDTEAAAASDDLDTITAGYEGQIVTLFAASSVRDVVLKDGTGNLRLVSDMTLDTAHDSITLMYRTVDSVWVELSRSNNA